MYARLPAGHERSGPEAPARVPPVAPGLPVVPGLPGVVAAGGAGAVGVAGAVAAGGGTAGAGVDAAGGAGLGALEVTIVLFLVFLWIADEIPTPAAAPSASAAAAPTSGQTRQSGARL